MNPSRRNMQKTTHLSQCKLLTACTGIIFQSTNFIIGTSIRGAQELLIFTQERMLKRLRLKLLKLHFQYVVSQRYVVSIILQ